MNYNKLKKNKIVKKTITLFHKITAYCLKLIDSINILPAAQPIKWGIGIIAVFFGTFGLWALFAPINSAAVTQGTIALGSNIKIIQHLEGGIIEAILVREGDLIKKGQELIILDKTSSKAELDLLYSQLRADIAEQIRLNAEQNNEKILVFNHSLLIDTKNLEIKKIIDTQNRLFKSRNENFINKISIMNNQIEQLGEQISGLNYKKESTNHQLILIKKEKKIVEELVKQGTETQPRLLALSRHGIELKGGLGELRASIAETKQKINQTKLSIINLKTENQKELAGSIHETQVKINYLKEKIIAAKDILNRLKITAPHSGIVTNLKFHTKGGVIPPRMEIMTLIPQDDELIIEAKLKPQDIDVVHKGLKAKIRLLAYKSRYTPMLTGNVIHISPDKLIDPIMKMPYYLVRVKVDNIENQNTYKFKNKNITLYPGMPAEVLIITGKRTFVSYMLDPIKKTFRRAFRED